MDNKSLIKLLSILCIVVVFILFILGCILIYVYMRNKIQKQKEKEKKEGKNTKVYDKDNIANFIKFEKIEDNMIIKENNEFLMIIECQGVNFYVMSDLEKIDLEEGFLKALDTIEYPIQIHIQTQTINLDESLQEYEKKIKNLEEKYNKKLFEYKQMKAAGIYTKEDFKKIDKELLQRKQIYEYGKEVLENTRERITEKKVLSKKYYIIVPISEKEMDVGQSSKEEIQNMAFSELYTRTQMLQMQLSKIGVYGKILDSEGILEMLNASYNKGEDNSFELTQDLRAGYEDLYSISSEVTKKKEEFLNKQIVLPENQENVLDERSRLLIEKEKNKEMATIKEAEKMIMDNEKYLGEDVAKDAIKMIEKDKNKSKLENENQTKERRVRK